MNSVQQAVEAVQQVSELAASNVHVEEFDFDGVQWVITVSSGAASVGLQTYCRWRERRDQIHAHFRSKGLTIHRLSTQALDTSSRPPYFKVWRYAS